jgi:hypothetical protein
LAFCDSVGLGYPARQGRFGSHRLRIQRLLKLLPGVQTPSPSEDDLRRVGENVTAYRVAFTEGLELAEITEYLRRETPSGFESRLKIALGGPELPSDEDPGSNRARNLQFELKMATTLAGAGFPPKLAEPDLQIMIGTRSFHLACKRIFAPTKVPTRLREAGEQLRRSLRDEPATARGIVAILLSRLLSPDASAFSAVNTRHAAGALVRWLEMVADMEGRDVRRLFGQGHVALVLFFASADFVNEAARRIERGGYFVGQLNLPPFAPYRRELQELTRRLDAIATIDLPAREDLKRVD